jgi:tetratricopeptide (TPR) repeat protein
MKKTPWILGVAMCAFLTCTVAYGQDLNTQMLQAVQDGNSAQVSALLKQGADVNAKDEHGITALMRAARKSRSEIVRLLLDKGAQVNAKDEHGITALMNLMIARWKGTDDWNTAQLLVDKGADINAKDMNGLTPLMWAAMRNPSGVKFLLEKGADASAKDNFARTAFDYAGQFGGPATHDEIVAVLRSDKGSRSKAIAEYREALRINPNNYEVHDLLGSALDDDGDHAGAIAEYREALRLKPDYLKAHNNLGHALCEKGDYDGAAAEFQEMLRLDPDSAHGGGFGNIDAHLGLGAAWEKRGYLTKAINEYRVVFGMHPNGLQYAQAEEGYNRVLKALKTQNPASQKQ